MGLSPLWKYTALKPPGVSVGNAPGLSPLWKYTALKLPCVRMAG